MKVNNSQNFMDLNQGVLYLWSKFGDPNLNRWWVYGMDIGRGPEGSTMHPPTSLQNYVFLNPQSVHNKKWDVNSKNIGTHYWFTALF